jgi:hypothetical protein
MFPRKNLAAIGKVQAADLRQESVEVKKELYIEQNTFDVGLDTPIFRIVPISYLLSDIESARLTHTRVGEIVWGDPAENPLAAQSFRDGTTGEEITLSSLSNEMFAVCWSLAPVASPEAWSYFSYGMDSARIRSTPRKLLRAAMDARNKYFMLQHFVGRIEYLTTEAVDAYFADPDWPKHLDSLGQGLVLSTCKLPSDGSSEEEVRLIYSMNVCDDWARNHVEIQQHHVRIPFDWSQVIESLTVGRHVSNENYHKLTERLPGLGIEGLMPSRA